jgi:hypothetical protein
MFRMIPPSPCWLSVACYSLPNLSLKTGRQISLGFSLPDTRMKHPPAQEHGASKYKRQFKATQGSGVSPRNKKEEKT